MPCESVDSRLVQSWATDYTKCQCVWSGKAFHLAISAYPNRDLVNIAPLQLGEEVVHFEAVADLNFAAGTILSASASNRGSPRSGSTSESTLIHPTSEPARL